MLSNLWVVVTHPILFCFTFPFCFTLGMRILLTKFDRGMK